MPGDHAGLSYMILFLHYDCAKYPIDFRAVLHILYISIEFFLSY